MCKNNQGLIPGYFLQIFFDLDFTKITSQRLDL